RHGYHRYQYFYFWIGILFYQLRGFIMSSVWLLQNQYLVRYKYELFGHFFAKLILISFIFLSGYWHGIGTALGLFITYSISFSFFAFLLLYNNHEETHHLLSGSDEINVYHEKLSWAETQVKTSGNWFPTNFILDFVEFHYGYFNYHIEHHLFPSFKPILLKKISPIVKEVCEKHNIPYISTSFLEVQRSFQSHLKNMSME
ncbi:MAG: fatty acid desaturase, partial [Synechocystis sp.]|nr:fatty acid desaturase [Synechocystis sp.]